MSMEVRDIIIYTYNYVNLNLGGQAMLNASTHIRVQVIIMSVTAVSHGSVVLFVQLCALRK